MGQGERAGVKKEQLHHPKRLKISLQNKAGGLK
jgi:hypothetical protein